ncbi:MAG: transglycosylase SLT domain-containing protein [Lewinellaceae bacterium]|nr:transglycosylase SLT domain-containing protein [Saprospiraceae bacterium]MCB9330232.1 transglycosylase SLT domain-containing protein [Lewinellaceae bacterium]
MLRKQSLVYWLVFVLLIIAAAPVTAQQDETDLAIDAETPEVAPTAVSKLPTDTELRERLGAMKGCLELKVDGVVHSYIRTYVQVKSQKTAVMLGRRLTYFPLFEEKLKEHGLPEDLKYLAVVESALNAKAVSRVGATGLWQFMPYTGKDYDLRQNTTVDERSDAVKSTEAAVKYLKNLYNQYNDWALALAAYNSGPGRVNSAIKRAHSRDFWKLQRFLPKETRNYVPAFIAATYICNYFPMHNLELVEPDYDEQLTNYVKVFENISFRDIADATGLDYGVIRTLNAGFKRDYVPASEDGYYVLLPERVMPSFLRYLNGLGGRRYTVEGLNATPNTNLGDGRYWQLSVSVQQTDHINQVAAMLGCNPAHLKSWNKLSSDLVQAGQRLNVWRPVYVFKHSPLRIAAPRPESDKASKPAATKPGGSQVSSAIAADPVPVINPAEAAQYKQYQFHTVRRNESLEDIARQYGTPIDVLRKINNCDSITIGMRLKVKEL